MAFNNINPLLSANLTSLALFGLWPFQSSKFLQNRFYRSLHYRLGLLFYILLCIFLISEYIELVNVWGDLEAMTVNMMVTFLTTLGIFKIYAFFGHRAKLKRLVHEISLIENRILLNQCDENKIILATYVKRARRVTYNFWFLTGFTIWVFIIIPPVEYVLSSTYHNHFDNGTEYWSYTKPMIFSSWFPFDKHAYPNYVIAFFYQMTMGLLGAAYQGTWDMTIVSMMIHSIGQLQILQNNFISSTKNKEIWKVSKRRVDKIKHMRLVDCVNHHRYIIKYTRTLNDIISPVMILYFMICSFMLCTILFQATSHGISFHMCLMLEYLVALMVQLFLFYWHANEVLIEKEKLIMATYSCKWFNESERFNKSLWIIREGVKIPIRFTVGQFYTISVPTFLTILRATYSYFTLLRRVQEKG